MNYFIIFCKVYTKATKFIPKKLKISDLNLNFALQNISLLILSS